MVGTERRVVCCLKIYLRDHWSITLLTKLSWGGGGRSWRESTTTMTVRLDHALLSGLTLFIFMTFSLIASFFKWLLLRWNGSPNISTMSNLFVFGNDNNQDFESMFEEEVSSSCTASRLQLLTLNNLWSMRGKRGQLSKVTFCPSTLFLRRTRRTGGGGRMSKWSSSEDGGVAIGSVASDEESSNSTSMSR